VTALQRASVVWLVVKIGAAIAVLLVGGYNRFVLFPDIAEHGSARLLIRNVGLESAALCGVLWLAAILANTPPAH
jgi:putative copper export protein